MLLAYRLFFVGISAVKGALDMFKQCLATKGRDLFGGQRERHAVHMVYGFRQTCEIPVVSIRLSGDVVLEEFVQDFVMHVPEQLVNARDF